LSDLTDMKGQAIEVGSRVAYNLSGDVALGTVESIRPGVEYDSGRYPYRRWKVRPLVKVRADREWARQARSGGVSTLTIISPGDVGKITVLP
jgi:hypothetical protein